jgi:hypothetical protein
MPLVGGTSSVTLYFTIGANKYLMRLPLRSESINPKYGAVNKSEALTGSRAPIGVFVGKLAHEGNIEFELHDFTDTNATPSYKHSMLAVALWSVLGSYGSGTVSLNTSSAPKFDYIRVTHGNSDIIYQDVYVSNLSIRVNNDGIPTGTLDVRAKSIATSISGTYTDITRNFGRVYNATHFVVKVGSSDVTSKVASIEITIPQNIIDYYTLGSLNARNMIASSLEIADVRIEYYPDSVTNIDLDNALRTAFENGTPSSNNVIVEITSPTVSTTKATLTLGSPFVTEYTHDINGPEYITANLSLQVSPSNISLSGILIG